MFIRLATNSKLNPQGVTWKQITYNFTHLCYQNTQSQALLCFFFFFKFWSIKDSIEFCKKYLSSNRYLSFLLFIPGKLAPSWIWFSWSSLEGVIKDWATLMMVNAYHCQETNQLQPMRFEDDFKSTNQRPGKWPPQPSLSEIFF